MPAAKILIVEDEAIAAMDIQQRLVRLGYPQPDVAYSGEEGVRKVEESQPDLVLMDIMMPGKLDGIAAAEQIRSRFDVPIIFITAYTDENTLSRAKITAPYGYIVKPFQERELHITVDMALYRHKMERELREREKWLATTLRSIGEGVIATDEKGLITFMNPVAGELMGCKLEEVLQSKLTDVFNIVNRDTRRPVENPVMRVLLEGNIIGLANHTLLISRDGKEIPINDSAAPIKDERGKILGAILVFSDSTERENADEALRQSEERFRLLVENVRDYAIFMLDLEGRVATWNEGAERLKGYKADEIIGKPFSLFYSAEEVARDKPRRELKAAIADGKFEEEGWRVRKDGSRFWASVLITAMHDDAGTLRGFVKVTHDITERKRAEEALGKARDELELRVRERTQELKEADKSLLEINETLEQRIVHRTAELRAANETLRFSRVAALNLMEDAIDARRQAEKVSVELSLEVAARKQSEERLERAQEIAHLGSWELDLAGNRLFWSDEVYRIFGLQPQEFAATYEAFLERVHPDDRSAVDAAYSSSLLEGRDAYEIEHRVIRKSDGEIRIVLEKCEHFRDESGRIIRSGGMVHDISELKQAEHALKQSNTELANVNRELESFVYSASHDLRAPLRHISTFADLVTKQYSDRLDEKGRDYLIRICKSTSKMTAIIDDLLRLSRVSRQEVRLKSVDLSEMASSIIADLRESDPGRQIEVIIRKGLVVQADPGLMGISLSNLLGNAWKFTSRSEHARIEFGAKLQDGKQFYYIRDNGAGFDMKFAEKMFWPFHRLHAGSEFEGTGIGLAIVERVIRRHGGNVWAEGEAGKGATIYFRLGD